MRTVAGLGRPLVFGDFTGVFYSGSRSSLRSMTGCQRTTPGGDSRRQW